LTPAVLADRCFDAVLCNPPIRAGKRQVMRLLQDAAARLPGGGVLWLVVRTDKGAKSLARDLAGDFADIQTLCLPKIDAHRRLQRRG